MPGNDGRSVGAASRRRGTRTASAAASALAAVLVLLGACGGGPSQPAAAGGKPGTTAAASTAAKAGAAGKSTLTTVKVGAIVPTQVPLLPWYTAIDRGIFAKNALAVSFVMAKPPGILSAMSTGEIQFSVLPDTTANGAEKKLPVRIVAVAALGLNDDIVAAKDIHSPAGLKGKVFVASATSFSAPGRVALTYLSQHGVPRSALKVTYASTPSSVVLLKSGRAAGIVVDTPTAVKLGEAGYQVLAPLITFFRGPNAGVGATLHEIRRHPGTVRAVIRSVLAGAQILKNNRTASVAEIQKHYHLDASEAGRVWAEIHGSYVTDGRVPPADFAQMLAEDKADLRLPSMPTASQVSDFSLLPATAG